MISRRIASSLSSGIKSALNTSFRTITTTQKCLNAGKQSTEPLLVEIKTDYVILKMNKPPVNSLSLEFLTALTIQLDKLEETKNINGVILTSNVPNIFSAGLDILEMYKCKPERARQFWQTLQDVWIKLYGSNKIYIAAITGHAPAGGCLLTLCCDYRIMSQGPYKIGLNETLLGIKAPFWFSDSMINVIGNRETEKALQLGTLYSAQDALKINLVDELADNPQNVITQAEAQMKVWLKIPTIARELTKSSMRRDTISRLLSQRDADIDQFVEFAQRDYVQKSLETYLEALKKRK